MIAHIDEVKRAGNTLGGICEVVVDGLPVGLGSHVSWDRKLDGRIGAAIMSIPAVKGVEIGMGFQAARVHRRRGARRDRAWRRAARAPGNVRRATNRAGGLEGGMTTGEPLVVRVAMKPISTLMRPLGTVDVATGEAAAAVAERSDVTAVPAMGVIAEAMSRSCSPTRCSRSSAAIRSPKRRRNYRCLPFARRSPARRLIRPSRTSSSSASRARERRTVGQARRASDSAARSSTSIVEIERREGDVDRRDLRARRAKPTSAKLERELTEELDARAGTWCWRRAAAGSRDPETVALVRPPAKLDLPSSAARRRRSSEWGRYGATRPLLVAARSARASSSVCWSAAGRVRAADYVVDTELL